MTHFATHVRPEPVRVRKNPRLLKRFVEAYSTGPSRAVLRSFEADLLSQIPLESPVLDLACGDGLVSALTYGRALEHGCDLTMNQLEKAKARRQYKAMVQADVRELPYKNSTFATIISNSSIEHIPRVEEVLADVFRVLKLDGLFVFTVPNPRFNEWFWTNWLWSRLGKPARGQTSIENFNKLREHHNVYDASYWHELLHAAGFSQVWHTEYFPFRTTFVFSLLEHLWTYDLVIRRAVWSGAAGKRVNLGGGVLLLLPRWLRIFLQTQLLSLFSRQRPFEQGSHLLMTARKQAG